MITGVWLQSCGNSGCDHAGSLDYYYSYNGIKDIRIESKDTSSSITRICYPQVNSTCIKVERDDVHYGVLLRGFDETIIEMNLRNGQKEIIHFAYKRKPYYSDCNDWEFDFKDLRVVNTTIEKYNLSYKSIMIQKY